MTTKSKTQAPDVHHEAFAQMPGYHDAKAALDVVTTWNTEHAAKTVTPIERTAADELRTLATKGAEFPIDIGHRYRMTMEANADHIKNGELLHSLKSALAVDLENIVKGNSDAALSYLAEELAALVEDVREDAGNLDGLDTLEAVAKTDGPQLDAWRCLAGYLDRYNTIRATQWELVSRTLHNNGGDRGRRAFLSVGLLADALDRDAQWISQRNAGTRSDYATGDRAAYNTWLSQGTTGRPRYQSTAEARHWIPTEHAEQYLIWICTTARPWVPSIDDMGQAHDAASTAAGIVTTPDQLKYRTEARQRYYEITGATPSY